METGTTNTNVSNTEIVQMAYREPTATNGKSSPTSRLTTRICSQRCPVGRMVPPIPLSLPFSIPL